MNTYSILLRDRAQADGGHPLLLAYEISDQRAAQTLVSGIAASYREHGFNPATRIH